MTSLALFGAIFSLLGAFICLGVTIKLGKNLRKCERENGLLREENENLYKKLRDACWKGYRIKEGDDVIEQLHKALDGIKVAERNGFKSICDVCAKRDDECTFFGQCMGKDFVCAAEYIEEWKSETERRHRGNDD